MAYTTINNGKIYFNTKLYTGNGSTQSITGVGFQPDMVWNKARNATEDHALVDAVRGVTKTIYPSDPAAEQTRASGLTAFGADGYTVGNGTYFGNNGTNYASWNWIASGTAPSNTYAVTVVSDGGNKYRFDGYGTSAVTLEISEGGTYTFDQADASNSGHPIRFSTTSDGSHGGGSEYTTGVTTNGTPGNAGAYTRITVAASAPTLYYYCTAHSGMGGQANTPTTNSFSNFSGSVQTNISPNTTSGFSIVKYTGTGANATIGHGLGAVPKMIIVKNLIDTEPWVVYHAGIDATAPQDYHLRLNTNDARVNEAAVWNDTAPTSSVFSLGSSGAPNGSGDATIAYCFAEKKGYSKFGSYTGNGNANGTFIYTGFKPAFVLWKRTEDAGYDWDIYDTARDTYNVAFKELMPNNSSAESSATVLSLDILSNGFKLRTSNGNGNDSGKPYIYIAFAENPFTSSTGTPVTAR